MELMPSIIENKSSHNFDSNKAKTSLRINYEAQVEAIRGQIGNLEHVREKLGLSARKMTQLLMVDPSAWTRWTKPGASAPPHVWRALQWYMIVQEKVPGLNSYYFIGRETSKRDTHQQEKIEKLEAEIHELKMAVKANRMTAIMLGIGAIIMAIAFWKMIR